MNIIDSLKTAIQHIGNGKYKDATAVLERALMTISKGKVKEKIEEKDVVVGPYTKGDLYGLNKQEQTEMLKSLGAKRIPRLEINKVNLILELQVLG